MIYQMHPEHGRHMATNNIEQRQNEKNGWKTVTEEEFYAGCYKDVPHGTTEVTSELEGGAQGEIPRAVLEDLYEAKFGKKPPKNAKDDTLKAKLEE